MGLEIISGVERRRRWSAADKLRIVAAADEPGAKVAEVDVGIVAARAGGAEPRLVLGQIDDGGQRSEQLCRHDRVAGLHRGLVDHGDGSDFLLVKPLDVRTSDDEALELHGGVGYAAVRTRLR